MDNKICIVLMCDKVYFSKFLTTCELLLTTGNYKGDICLLIGDDLNNDNLLNHELILKNNIIIKYFPNIIFPHSFLEINNNLITTDGRNITKKFQWHKLHLFDMYFKQWGFIFYLDCGMTIYSDIAPMLNEFKPNKIIAHSDAYPIYEWKLKCQFENNNEYYKKLEQTYNLNIDYFQTGIILFDTNIIETDTYDNIYNLALEYPISRTNEQGIIALYFTNIKPLFQQINTHNENTFFYDALSRNSNNKYIMLKMIF